MSPRRPLVGLLVARPDADRVIAFGGTPAAFGGTPAAFGETPASSGGTPGDSLSHARLLSDVFALAGRFGGDRGKRWLVETEDAYRIAVALLAASVAGARIALPPNLQPGTLRELASRSDRILADAGSASPDAFDPLAAGRDAPGGAHPAFEIDRSRPLVELFTSGTSGPGKRITKSLCHLEDEAAEIESILARDASRVIPPDAGVFATVSAHHLYGLLFRVLWPLAEGRPFCRESFLLPDELLAHAGAAASAVLVSSPAHLRHLAQMATSPRAREHAPRISEIVSSGGPLESRTALALEEAFGQAPMEIFGSTETGGVAARRARGSDPDPSWKAFPSVRVEIDPADASLIVASPFVTPPTTGEPDSAGVVRAQSQAQDSSGAATAVATTAASATTVAGSATLRMGDRAEPDGDGFRLLGRSDRIAKVGEKTLSLPEIENCLAEHEMVESAACGTYPDRSGPRLGAVIVLARSGRLRLAQGGRRSVQGVLAEHLAERWDRVALPRRWRFVDALATDARGKLARESFEAELSRPVERPREPLVLAEHRSGNAVIRELVVPRDLAYFDGHYDGFPLVPGAVQVHWVMLALGRIAGRRMSAQRMEAIKFRNVLRPAELFTMQLAIDEAFSQATFTLVHESRVFSSGRITLGG